MAPVRLIPEIRVYARGMFYEYRAESHYRESPFEAEERWLFRLPTRHVRRGDWVTLEPFGRLTKVRWLWLFKWLHNPDFEWYVASGSGLAPRLVQE